MTVRLIVDREREIEKFVAIEYWSVDALLTKAGDEFTASLLEKAGKKIELKNREKLESNC